MYLGSLGNIGMACGGIACLMVMLVRVAANRIHFFFLKHCHNIHQCSFQDLVLLLVAHGLRVISCEVLKELNVEQI